MDDLLARHKADTARVLDVGSYDVNGTLRPLIEKRGWSYLGLDLEAGPNVDVVSEEPYLYPFAGGAFDVVVSAGTMEHVEALWYWIPELARMLRSGGLLALTTVWQCPEHRYPRDCWRILPDGMRFLFDEAEALRDYRIVKMDTGDLGASAVKR